MNSKVIPVEQAISHIESGMSLALGGFLNQGVPLTLIRALKSSDATDLTIYANDGGYGDAGIVELVKLGKVRKLVASYIGFTPAVGEAVKAGNVEIVWTPQGTLAEKMRCGGAGLGGFLTPTGVGTAVAEGKDLVSVAGRTYLLETAVRADVALVHAHVGDSSGNLRFRGTARNFNPVVATCADYVIAEVERLELGENLDPDDVYTSGIYIDAVVTADGNGPVAPPSSHVRQQHLG